MILDWPTFIQKHWPKLTQVVLPSVAGLRWSDQLIDECEGKGDSIFDLHDVQGNLASGFILRLANTWYYITAGHVLLEFESLEDMGHRAFKFGLQHGLDRDDAMVTQMDFAEAPRFVQFDSAGCDYGVIPIPPTARARMVKYGSRCVAAEHVALADDEFDGYLIAGFALQESKTLDVRDTPGRRDVRKRIGLQVLPVERVAPADVANQYRKDDPFVGRIISRRGVYSDGVSAELESLKGMSGGPIVGFRVADDRSPVSLRVVAIQSHESRAEDQIAGSRVAPLIEAAAQATLE